MSSLDLSVVFIYLMAVLGLGYLCGRGNEDQEDFLLAGRSMPWLPVSLSVAATMISANSFIGAPGWAYGSGLAPFMVNATVPLAVFFALSVTTPVFYALKVTSIYEYMGSRLGPLSRGLAVAQFFVNSLIQVSSMVFIPALILQRLTGMDLIVLVPVIVAVSIVYTVMGGIKAVIWTDFAQMLVLWGGLFAVIYVGLKGMDMGFFETLQVAREAGKMKALSFSFDLGDTNTFWASLIGGTFMWVRYFCFDQVQIQRVLTSKSMRGLKLSFMTSAFFMSVIYFISLLVGLLLWGFFDGRPFSNANDVMITFILENLPVGVVGLVISGALAAAMSSVDSLLNSMTTVFIKDVYEKNLKKDSGPASLRVTMAVAAFFGVAVVFFVLVGFGGTVRSVLDVVGKYISYFSGPACGAFLLAMFTVRANDRGVAVGFILGTVGCLWISRAMGLSWLWNPAVGGVLTLILGYGISLIFGNSEAYGKEYTASGVRRSLEREGRSYEDGVSVLPFKVDFYGYATLGFFFLQYLVLFLIQ